MELRYGIIDENVRKRSVEDVLLHERQRIIAGPAGGDPAKAARKNTCSGFSGKLALIRSINSLAAEKIRGKTFSPVILLPPGTEEEELRELVRQICRAAFPAGINILKVHAEVTDAVTRPVICGTMSGEPFRVQGDQPAQPANGKLPSGTDIVMAGTVGLEGTCILVETHREALAERFPETLLYRMQEKQEALCVLQPAKTAAAAGVSEMVSPSGGGFFAGLWELSKKTGCGLEVDLQAVPILQETIEITDHFAIHPYWMRSAGCLLMAACDSRRLLQTFLEEGIPAVRIGRLLPGKKEKILLNGEEVRYLDRPQTDSLDLFERNMRERNMRKIEISKISNRVIRGK